MLDNEKQINKVMEQAKAQYQNIHKDFEIQY